MGQHRAVQPKVLDQALGFPGGQQQGNIRRRKAEAHEGHHLVYGVRGLSVHQIAQADDAHQRPEDEPEPGVKAADTGQPGIAYDAEGVVLFVCHVTFPPSYLKIKCTQKPSPGRGRWAARNKAGKKDQVNSRGSDEVYSPATMRTCLGKGAPHPSGANLLGNILLLGSAPDTFPCEGKAFGSAFLTCSVAELKRHFLSN